MTDRPAISFLVRLWLEPREIEDAAPAVRAYIRHLRTGEEHYTHDLNALTAFFLAALQEEGQQEQRRA